jgi:hypothetical protein
MRPTPPAQWIKLGVLTEGPQSLITVVAIAVATNDVHSQVFTSTSIYLNTF